jgi:hypothetical protein
MQQRQLQKILKSTFFSLFLLSSCGRNGEDIYESAFGEKPESVEIINSQDAIIPIIDFSVWIHFKAPAEELERIIEGYERSSFLGFPSSGIVGIPEDWMSEEDFNSCSNFKRQNHDDGSVDELYINCKNGEAIYASFN